VVSEHGSPLRLNGLCVFFMHSCWLHACLLCLYSMCLLHLHGVDHGCSDVAMWKVMVLCGMHRHECMNGYMSLYVANMYHSCMLGYIIVGLITFSYVWLHVSFL